MSGPPHAFHDAPAEAATAREALEDAALAGTYERPRPRTSREVERAAPAPLPEPAAERLPTPKDVDLGALGFLAEMLHNRAGGPTVLVAIAEIRARRARDAAILARLDAATAMQVSKGDMRAAVLALMAELRGGAS